MEAKTLPPDVEPKWPVSAPGQVRPSTPTDRFSAPPQLGDSFGKVLDGFGTNLGHQSIHRMLGFTKLQVFTFGKD